MFFYGGFVKSKLISDSNEILGAKNITHDFSALKNGEQFIITTDNSDDAIFTYSKKYLDPSNGYFSNMQSLSDAINMSSDYNARLINGQLYVASQDSAHTIEFKNMINEDEVGISSNVSNLYGQDSPKEYLNSLVLSNTSPIYGATTTSDPFIGMLNDNKLNITLSNREEYNFTFQQQKS